MINIAVSLAAMERQDAGGATKIAEDLDRYSVILNRTKPDVIVECGTWRGGSALWFAGKGYDVVTVDIDGSLVSDETHQQHRITCVTGDSIDENVVSTVVGLTFGKRVMVVLDSDHSPYHVRREIESYGPLVSVGCPLVVEDTLLRWVPSPLGRPTPGPLDAVEFLLDADPAWRRDEEIEHMHPVSMNPAGWWIRSA